MKRGVSSGQFFSLLIVLVAGAIFLPRGAAAVVIPLSSLPVQQTGLDQSAFQNLASCALVNAAASTAFGTVTIDQPAGKMAYRGANQPWLTSAWGYESVWFCDKREVDATLVKGGKWYNPYANVRELTTAEITAVWAIGNLISLSATIAAWIIWLASQLLSPLLGVGSFITNPMVRSGWPFVQGIANLGFLLALLFIAFATTLRIDSFSVRKTLPRLLIAALLINFSLVITGLLIDVSRLVMAALLAILGNNARDDLAFNLLQSSNVIKINFDLQTFQSHGYAAFQGKTTSWQTVASTLQAAILMWGLAAGFIILIVGLLMRYIMLILLLIVSPLAFLAVALPNTAQLAKKWWSTFIMYVLYGPVAVFILILTVAASQGLASNNNTFIINVLNLFVVIAMMIAAAVAGKKLGFLGAGAAVSFVSKQGQRAGRVGLGVATYIPRKAATTASKAAGEQIGGAKKGLVNYGLARMGFDPNAKKTVAQKFMERRLPPLTTAQRTAAANARRDVGAAVARGAAHGPANVRTPTLAPNQLQQKHIVQDMTEQEIRFLVESQHTTSAQKENLLSNPEAVKKFQGTQEGRTLIQDIFVNRDTNSDRPTNIGTDAEKRQAAADNAQGRGNQALVNALMKGFDKLDNPPA